MMDKRSMIRELASAEVGTFLTVVGVVEFPEDDPGTVMRKVSGDYWRAWCADQDGPGFVNVSSGHVGEAIYEYHAIWSLS